MDWRKIVDTFKLSYDLNLLKNENIIDKIYFRKRVIDSNSYGWEANCYLSSSLGVRFPSKMIHSNSHGMGSDYIKNRAISKSISEAIERWAYFETKNKKCEDYIISPNTSGFSAFPRKLKKQARDTSIYEAYERWCLFELNKNRLSLEYKIDQGEFIYFHFNNELKIFFAIIEQNLDLDRSAYGFAAARSLKDCLFKARVEKNRNIFNLNYFKKNNLKIENLDRNERRLIYFSTNEGNNYFKSLLNLKNKVRTPKMLYSKEVEGKWSKYSAVWRTVFDIDPIIHDNKLQVFYF